MLVITDAVVAFLQVARSIAVGTCDALGRPHATRAAAVRLWDDRQHVTLFLAQAISAPTLENVRGNPRLALQISSPIDHRTLQLKGRVVQTRSAEAGDEAFVHQFVEDLGRVVDQLGMPFERVVRMRHWPAHAFDVRVEATYLQTPGPGAGQPLAGRSP